MKTKVIRCVAFILLVSGLFLGLNSAYVHTYHYQTIDGYFLYQSMPEKLDIVNFGTSQARNGIDYRPFGEYSGFNFAFADQGLDMDWLMMQSYEEHFAEDCVVLIPLSFFALYNDVSTYSMPRYMKYLKPELVPDYTLRDAIFYRYLPVLSARKDLLRLTRETSAIDLAYGYDLFGLLDATLPKAERDEFGRLFVQVAWQEMRMQGKQEISVRQWSAISNMLAACQENGWQAVIVTLPTPNYVHKYIPDTLLETFYQDVDTLLASFAGVPVWDYANDLTFVDNPDLFADGGHLNKAGNHLFTSLLLEDCRNAGYLP